MMSDGDKSGGNTALTFGQQMMPLLSKFAWLWLSFHNFFVKSYVCCPDMVSYTMLEHVKLLHCMAMCGPVILIVQKPKGKSQVCHHGNLAPKAKADFGIQKDTCLFACVCVCVCACFTLRNIHKVCNITMQFLLVLHPKTFVKCIILQLFLFWVICTVKADKPC